MPLNYKQGCVHFLEDGLVPMTNSLDERTIRPFYSWPKLCAQIRLSAYTTDIAICNSISRYNYKHINSFII